MSSWTQQETKIVMVGLDAAGKTTVLYKLKLGEVITTAPTIGFNVETVAYKKLDMTVWDIGGQDLLRKLWRHYYTNVDAIIFIVDSNDRERIDLAATELFNVLQDEELKTASVLVYANKQDLPNSMDTSEVVERIGMHNMRGRDWHVQSCTATTGDGLWEGLDWLNDTLQSKRYVK
jgi:ADP-ribosylation factor 1/2